MIAATGQTRRGAAPYAVVVYLSDNGPIHYPRFDMADTRTKEQRRRIMRSVGVEDTGPEWAVRRLLHGCGYRYRLHRKDLPGRPDLVFPSRRKAIFVHGCFWHAHGCRYGRPPKSRLDYWLPKLERNRQRDAEKRTALEALRWRVLVVWQCETRDLDTLAAKLCAFLDDDGG